MNEKINKIKLGVTLVLALATAIFTSAPSASAVRTELQPPYNGNIITSFTPPEGYPVEGQVRHGFRVGADVRI